jgi:hypothetical protein
MDKKFEANEISEYFRRVHRDSLRHGSRDSLGPVISPGGNCSMWCPQASQLHA